MVIVNLAILTDGTVDRADEIRFSQWTHAGFEWAGEKIIEALVASHIWIFCFVHIDAVFVDKPADEPGRQQAAPSSGDGASEGGKTLLGQEVLKQDLEAIRHL